VCASIARRRAAADGQEGAEAAPEVGQAAGDEGPPPPPSPPLVSVIMTTSNSSAFMANAVESVRAQTHARLELIIVDDSSTDDSFEQAVALAGADPRIRPVHALQAAGPFVARNLGLAAAHGDFVAFQDADGWSAPDRLARQVAMLESTPAAVACICNYERRGADGGLILNRGLPARRSTVSLLFRRGPVAARLGFFDSVRTSADQEFQERLSTVFGPGAFAYLDEPLYQVRARPAAPTAASASKPSPAALAAVPGDAAFFSMSPARHQYLDMYRAWHRHLAAGAAEVAGAAAAAGAPAPAPAAFMPFPLTTRRFPAPAALLPSPGAAAHQDVHAAVASIPERQAHLQAVVAAIRPQVDVLHVFLDDYDEVPPFLRGDPAIRVARSQDWGNGRDNGKFFFLGEAGAYYLTLDDDLAYPADYVRTLLLAVEKYGRRAVVGVHGVWLAHPMARFYAGRAVALFSRALALDRGAHLLGTGTVAFHRDTLALTYRDFGEPGMADLWFAVAARRQGVPLVCVARDAGWLTNQDPGTKRGSLFREYEANDGTQTRVARAHGPWDGAALARAHGGLAGDLLARFSPAALTSRGINASELAELAAAADGAAGATVGDGVVGVVESLQE
jgi:hypothetical protein